MILNYLYSWYPVKYTIYDLIINSKNNDKNNNNKNNNKNKIKVGLLTNEIPPIIYGGVATWIVNFIKMFKNDDKI